MFKVTHFLCFMALIGAAAATAAACRGFGNPRPLLDSVHGKGRRGQYPLGPMKAAVARSVLGYSSARPCSPWPRGPPQFETALLRNHWGPNTPDYDEMDEHPVRYIEIKLFFILYFLFFILYFFFIFSIFFFFLLKILNYTILLC